MSNERAVLTRELNKSICFIHLKILSFASLYVVCWAMSLQLCPTLCNHIDGSLPGSSVYGILQQEYWGRLPFPPPSLWHCRWRPYCWAAQEALPSYSTELHVWRESCEVYNQQLGFKDCELWQLHKTSLFPQLLPLNVICF